MKRGSIELVRIIICLIATVAMFTCIHFGWAAAEKPSAPGIPRTMLYEGYLTDSRGNPIPDGNYDFTFSLYTSATGGTTVWVEKHKNVMINNGLVRVHLGKGTTPNPLDIPFDQPYFLGISIDNDPEMGPRLELATSAYSFRATTADDVRDGAITSAKLAPLSVTDDKIESISWDKITGIPSLGPILTPVNKPGAVPANVWSIRGNLRTDPEKNFLGTADYTDLIFRTNNIPRLNITADGEVIVLGCLKSESGPKSGCFYLADEEHGLKRIGDDNVHLYTTDGDILLDSKNVGIGTQTPEGKLHIVAGESAALLISSTLSGNDSDPNSYPVRIDGRNQGVSIKLDNDEASSSSNYMSFRNNNGIVGRIEGQTYSEYLGDPCTEVLIAHMAGISAALVLAFIPSCPPFDFCPDWEGIVANSVTLAYDAVIFHEGKPGRSGGISYASGNGDYAEYLPRLHEDEEIGPGDIVGVFGGRVSKNTVGAQQILPISLNPIVLGNTPPRDQESRYEKVAFMGQVRVKVIGPVKSGDFIIPSGLDDGTGVAVSPEVMTADEYAKVVGRAWDTSDAALLKMVNVAVGLNPGDIASFVKRQQGEVGELRAELDELKKQVAALRELTQRTVQEQTVPAESNSVPVVAHRDGYELP